MEIAALLKKNIAWLETLPPSDDRSSVLITLGWLDAILQTRNVEQPSVPDYQPLEVAVAMSLYAYNVSPADRAEELYTYFESRRLPCPGLNEYVRWMDQPKYAATELPSQSALAYVQLALTRYGSEARARVRANFG